VEILVWCIEGASAILFVDLLHVFIGNGLKSQKLVFGSSLSNDGLDFLATIYAEYEMWI
jgi:hypothetical protein